MPTKFDPELSLGGSGIGVEIGNAEARGVGANNGVPNGDDTGDPLIKGLAGVKTGDEVMEGVIDGVAIIVSAGEAEGVNHVVFPRLLQSARKL